MFDRPPPCIQHQAFRLAGEEAQKQFYQLGKGRDDENLALPKNAETKRGTTKKGNERRKFCYGFVEEREIVKSPLFSEQVSVLSGST
jgi:hypothetical protein